MDYRLRVVLPFRCGNDIVLGSPRSREITGSKGETVWLHISHKIRLPNENSDNSNQKELQNLAFLLKITFTHIVAQFVLVSHCYSSVEPIY